MRFFYLRDVNGHAIGCIASDLVEEKVLVGQGKPNQIVKFAVSVCNPIDAFSRAQARELAAGRIATGAHTEFVVRPEMRGQIKRHILQYVADDKYGVAQRAREAAQTWVKHGSFIPPKDDNPVVGERFTAEDYKNGREGAKITLADTQERDFGKRTSTPATSSSLANA